MKSPIAASGAVLALALLTSCGQLFARADNPSLILSVGID